MDFDLQMRLEDVAYVLTDQTNGQGFWELSLPSWRALLDCTERPRGLLSQLDDEVTRRTSGARLITVGATDGPIYSSSAIAFCGDVIRQFESWMHHQQIDRRADGAFSADEIDKVDADEDDEPAEALVSPLRGFLEDRKFDAADCRRLMVNLRQEFVLLEDFDPVVPTQPESDELDATDQFIWDCHIKGMSLNGTVIALNDAFQRNAPGVKDLKRTRIGERRQALIKRFG